MNGISFICNTCSVEYELAETLPNHLPDEQWTIPSKPEFDYYSDYTSVIVQFL